MVYTKEASQVEIVTEGSEQVIKINYEDKPYTPSIEDNSLVMMDAIDRLIENPAASRITFSQKRNYTYTYDQTKMLIELANIYSYFIKSKRATNLQSLGLSNDQPELLGQRLSVIQTVMLTLLKQDPLGAYAELKRIIRRETINLKTNDNINYKNSLTIYLNILNEIFAQLDKTLIVEQAREYLPGYTLGDREVYRLLFKPTITPDFMFTRIQASPPLDGEQLSVYKLNDSTEVNIFRTPNDVKPLYHITPPEFKISEDKFELIDLAKKVLSEHQPNADEFLDPDKMRASFSNISKDLLRELAEQKNMFISPEEIDDLAEILVRNTVGFGVVELLLEDEKIQDLTINSPMGQVPIFILHEDFNECTSNIIPTTADFESWATKFRLLSGRPLDEANPILDTEIILPKARSRLSIIGKPLNPYGFGMAFRRHRDTPWTLPLFLKNKMISPLGAGLLSFTIDGARSHLIAGTRSSGKTSFLTSLLLEISRRYRILTIEDSVTKDCEILVKENNLIHKIKIGDLIDTQLDQNWRWYDLSAHEVCGNPKNIEILSMNKEGKINYSKVSKFIRHKVNKKIYTLRTSSGKTIKVTGDHSLFTLNNEGIIQEIKTSELKHGNYLATPRKILNNNLGIKQFNILNYPEKFQLLFFKGGNLREFLLNHKIEILSLAKDHNYKKAQINKWFRVGLIPGKILSDLVALEYNINNLKNIQWKCGKNSFWLSTEFELNETLLTIVGLWLADGCYDRDSLIFSVGEPEERDLVKTFGLDMNLTAFDHSDKFSLMLNSKSLKFFFREILNLKGTAYTKKFPSWIFNLTSKQCAFVLKGLFSGDGHVSSKEIMISLCSRRLLEDIQTTLLFYGIILRIGICGKTKGFESRISTVRDFKLFKENINLLQKYKQEALNKLCEKISTHDISDIIPFSNEFKKRICSITKSLNSNDYVNRNNNLGRTKLSLVCNLINETEEIYLKVKTLTESDLYWDKIVEVNELEATEDYVYDLSVPENESFICNNIIAHNTLEIPTDAMRELGYNVQPLKVRSALVKGGSEIPADEGIRTSLRLGDSALIVGEVRSTEASALYEAMRIGASANVVAGTIHGDSPYGVFDRVVNDLKVPKTSFKATDIIVMCNPIRSADGMKKVRRVTSITEVRKTWEDDPLAERGFVDLMRYNAKTDLLEPTPELINGDSEILKAIGANVREWVGNWDAIWDNIVLRGELKKMIVDYSEKLKMPQLLEAEFCLHGNDQFYRITGQVQSEVGFVDLKRIKIEWEEWLKQEIQKKQMH
ncbi:Flp pilus assembly complex ATPase component TadA [Candidatus Woesearchaeota archaeon]|nr:Flp pilus assembly complex ATPase component TadA [Candidatus Woesearchaeota archaeon]